MVDPDDQPLFPAPTTTPDHPTTEPCPLCGQPRRWLPRAHRIGNYCGGSQCVSRERICQECGQTFHMSLGESGTRICSDQCRNIRAVKRQQRKSLRDHPVCAWCRNTLATYSPRTYNGHPVCNVCLGPISHVLGRLRRHHVPISFVFTLLADPACPTCGLNMLTPIRLHARSHPTAPLVVDHDHDCCPGDYSCGECVRGLICSSCNFTIGQAHNRPDVLRALADYLEPCDS